MTSCWIIAPWLLGRFAPSCADHRSRLPAVESRYQRPGIRSTFPPVYNAGTRCQRPTWSPGRPGRGRSSPGREYSSSPPTGSPVAMRETWTPERLDHPRDVHRGGLAVDVGAGRDDDLARPAGRRRRAGGPARRSAGRRGRCPRAATAGRGARGSGRGSGRRGRSRSGPTATRPRRSSRARAADRCTARTDRPRSCSCRPSTAGSCR